MGYFLPVRDKTKGKAFSVVHVDIISGLSWSWCQDASADNILRLICHATLDRATDRITVLYH
jgi:hypothetical protein